MYFATFQDGLELMHLLFAQFLLGLVLFRESWRCFCLLLDRNSGKPEQYLRKLVIPYLV
jgi:hypothetical protein